MWFKNIIFYRFTQPVTLTADELEKQLKKKRFHGCGSQDISTYGWVPPLGQYSDNLTHSVDSFIMITACKEEKILPSSVIRDALDEKIMAIEQEQERKMLSKEKKLLKNDIIMDLLPRAFTRLQNTFAYIDTKQGWMIVDSSSFNKAEELTSYLRKSIGSLPIINTPLKNTPSNLMTQWLSQKAEIPSSFILGNECELREPGDEGGQIKAIKQVLISEEIGAHIEAGKQVSKLALCWDDTLTFILGDDLIIRKLKFTDIFKEQLNEINTENAAEQFDADFSLMTLKLQKLILDIINVLGGENTEINKVEHKSKSTITVSSNVETV